MPDGKFYLGRETSPKDQTLTDESYLYKADHLTTHSIVFGMTGSGKTGLCVDLLEEAIEEDVPIIIIDPKGDLTNLALMFPDFSPEDFLPWVSPVEATKKGKSLEEYAADMAEKWKKGVGSWGIDAEYMRTIKDKADVKVFTPGSSAGMRISILEGFKKPEADFEDDEEGMVEKIRNTVSALLALLDVDNDPLKSKPHILISNIIEYYWRMGRSVTIEELIINIQKPPIKKLGVFDVDQLMDEKERTELSFQINNVIASPSFRFWTAGAPLSAETLYRKDGKKIPVNIFYIAHLSDNERMFFVTLLFNEIVYWIRRQSGSGNLKYLLYMDEIFGYLPPYPKNPPSKTPLLTLLKQARAFGLGVVLATQNPKDIDYKGLTNMGTWFVGKLLAEGDRERVMEGLGGVAMASGDSVKPSQLQDMIAALGSRRFLVKNVHAKGIKTFQTRWAMSYLAGPLTREQIKKLTGEQKKALKAQKAAAPQPEAAPKKKKSKVHVLPYAPKTDVPMEYLYDNSSAAGGYYSPHLYMDGEIIFDDNRMGLYVRKTYFVAAPIKASINWRKAALEEEPVEYDDEPAEGIDGFEPFKVQLNYSLVKRLQSSFKDFIFSNLSLELFANKELNLVSGVEETREAFGQRCRDVVEKMIDKEVEKKKDYYGTRIKRLQDRYEREELKVKKLESEHQSKRAEELVSAGESILGLLLGGRSRRGLSSAARRRRMTSSAATKVKMGKTKLAQLEEDIQALQEELEDKVADIEDSFYEKADDIKPLEVRLEKNDIIISRQALLWKLM
jgi:hypothetical protein